MHASGRIRPVLPHLNLVAEPPWCLNLTLRRSLGSLYFSNAAVSAAGTVYVTLYLVPVIAEQKFKCRKRMTLLFW